MLFVQYRYIKICNTLQYVCRGQINLVSEVHICIEIMLKEELSSSPVAQAEGHLATNLKVAGFSPTVEKSCFIL